MNNFSRCSNGVGNHGPDVVVAEDSEGLSFVASPSTWERVSNSEQPGCLHELIPSLVRPGIVLTAAMFAVILIAVIHSEHESPLLLMIHELG